MRKKALIIGARPSPFEGPWVNLEEGEWEVSVEKGLLGKVILDYEVDGSECSEVLRGEFTISGPVRMRARIITAFEYSDVHLDVRRVSHA